MYISSMENETYFCAFDQINTEIDRRHQNAKQIALNKVAINLIFFHSLFY